MSQRRRARDRRPARGTPLTPLAPSPRRRARPEPAPGWREAFASVPRELAAHRLATTVGVVIVLAAFALYLATAARDIVFGDTPELTAVALTFGVAHPPGYPIFTMLGWVLGELPLGSPPFRIALLSVICHVATVGVVYLTTYRFTRNVAAAAVAGALLATEPLFWSWSLVAEVFPLNDLLSATMLLFVALWHEHPERHWLLIGGGLVGGLGMADHQTIGLLSPAVFYLMWLRRDILLERPRVLLNTAIAFLLGLTPYLILIPAAAHHPVWSWGDLQSPGDLARHILRTEYGTATLIAGGQFTGGSPWERLLAFFGAMEPAQWLFLAAGAWWAWRVKRWYVTYLLIGFVIAGPGFTLYSNTNLGDETTRSILERFFLMPHTIVAPLAGFAVLAAAELAGRIPRASSRGLELAAAAVAVAAALAVVPLDYREIDRSNDHFARTFANDLWRTVPQGSLFLIAGDPVVYPLLYEQSVEGVRPHDALLILPLVGTDWYIREFKRQDPQVVVKADKFAPGAGQTKQLFDDNIGRIPLWDIGALPDKSAEQGYWFYSRGLVYEVRRDQDRVTIEQMDSDTQEIVAHYHPPKYSDLVGPFRTWERLAMVDYALGYYRVGKEYENGADSLKARNPNGAKQLYDGARQWYQRALEIDPIVVEAKLGLARLPG